MSSNARAYVDQLAAVDASASAAPSWSSLSPAALVEQARSGDRRAFSELTRRYRPHVFALALQLAGDAHDADDIAQDAFLLAFRKLDDFRAAAEFYTWLYRIALNLSLNVRRRNVRRRCEPLDDPRVALAVEVDAHGDPRRAVELRQLYARLITALDALAAPLRSTVVLVALHGMNHEQAARILACSTGTVAWRMHRARRQLAAALRPPSRRGSPQEEDSGIFLLFPALGR